jgi:DnaJ-class molecular chaperone
MDDYTHYDFLDLPPGASTARIEAAYQTIKQRLNGHSDEQMIRLIHEAYTILSNAEQRQRYDAELQRVAAAADAELKNTLDGQASRPTRRVQDVPMTLVTAVSAWAA